MGDENRRRHERFSVYAQVVLSKDGETVVLSVRNLSEGGLFVEAPIGEYPHIKVGSRFDLTISLGNDDASSDVEPPDLFARCRGRVVRRERSNPPGFAMTFEQLAGEQLAHIRALIESAPKR